MKIALITDLHANREAVQAVLAHASDQGVQQYVFLGDLVGYGADPGWVVDCVREHVGRGALVVRGNHDDNVANGPHAQMHKDATEVIDWTRAQLSAEQIEFLSTLPFTAELGECLFVHANAFDPPGWEYVQGRLEAARSLLSTQRRLTFCGHMHEPMLFHLSGTGKVGEFTPTPGMTIPLSTQRQWLVIPGACGQPRDGNPAAAYAVYDTERAELRYHRIPYEHDKAAAKVRAAGLPERLAQRLVNGR